MSDAISAPEAFGASFDVAPSSGVLELGEGLEGDPALAFRRTLGMFATGVTVLTTRVEEQVHGMTANAFMSVSLRPPLVLISIDRRARMGALLHEGTRFGVSVLEARQTGLSDRFAGRVADELPEATFEVVHETPLVEGALAHLVARIVRSYWGGDHSLFLGQVEYARSREGAPLLFHGGRYEHVLAGAPVFSALPKDRLAQILAEGTERAYADGETIVREGEPGDDLFVVLEGSVRIERRGRLVASFGEGDLFGEVAVLDGRPRSADAIAEGSVRALAVPRDAVRMAIEAEPQVAWELLGVLAARLRDA
jgi:flavin reductase (DIM6/NTAB) family NADH-FMN oxidoreductase RutF